MLFCLCCQGLYVCIYSYIHVHAYNRAYTHIHTYRRLRHMNEQHVTTVVFSLGQMKVQVYIYIYICICTHSCIHTYIHTYTPAYIHILMHTCTHTYTYTHTYVQWQSLPRLVSEGILNGLLRIGRNLNTPRGGGGGEKVL